MKKVFVSLLFSLMLVFVIPLSSAQGCPINLPSNTNDFMNQLTSINSDLQGCPIKMSTGAIRLLGTGNMKVTVNMNSGSTNAFSATIFNDQLTNVGPSPANFQYNIIIDESSFNQLLNDNFASFDSLYAQGKIKVQGGSFFRSIRIFFASMIAKNIIKNNQANNPTPTRVPGNGEPENCHETYLAGWEEYSSPNVKSQWDQYSAETDGVCQFPVGTAGPQGNDCVYQYQKVKNGATSWICWWNN